MNRTANRKPYEPRKHHLNYEQDDRRLQISQDVVVCWSANGYSYEALAQVVALTSLQITVVLLSAAGGDDRYRVGHQLTIPRYANRSEWSSRRCVCGGEEKYRHKDFLKIVG